MPRRGFAVMSPAVSDTDGYAKAVGGISIDAVRMGGGSGRASVVTAHLGDLTVTSCRLGFPMLSRTTVGDSSVIVAEVVAVSPQGSRWCEIDLEPGAIITYGPGSEHTAVNRPGLEFIFAVADVERLESHAAELALELSLPRRGEVHEIPRSPNTRGLSPAFSAVRQAAARHPEFLAGAREELLHALAHALTEEERIVTIGASKRIDSRKVVHDCVDYAEAIGRIPSLAELCLVAHVSERRLRDAFTEEFGLPPTRYFRLWALQQAHRWLRLAGTRDGSVTDVASRLGFRHLGRFAGLYKEVYGEAPSATLRGSTTDLAGSAAS